MSLFASLNMTFGEVVWRCAGSQDKKCCYAWFVDRGAGGVVIAGIDE